MEENSEYEGDCQSLVGLWVRLEKHLLEGSSGKKSGYSVVGSRPEQWPNGGDSCLKCPPNTLILRCSYHL